MARSAMWAAAASIGVARREVAVALAQVAATSSVVARALATALVHSAVLCDVSKINPELVEGLEFLFLFVVALGATTF